MSPTSAAASAQAEPGAVRTLEARYYTDPSIFKAEQEDGLSRSDLAICGACLAAAVGRRLLRLRDRGPRAVLHSGPRWRD